MIQEKFDDFYVSWTRGTPVSRKSVRAARAFSKQERQDLTLETAAQVLEEDGARALNTNILAERSGVALGSIYADYGTRDEVLLALLAREGAAFCASFEPVQLGEDWLIAATRVIRAVLATYRRRPKLAAALLPEEHRLWSSAPTGVFAETDYALFTVAEIHPAGFPKTTTSGPLATETLSTLYLSAMVTGMALVASLDAGLSDRYAEGKIVAALSGCLKWLPAQGQVKA